MRYEDMAIGAFAMALLIFCTHLCFLAVQRVWWLS